VDFNVIKKSHIIHPSWYSFFETMDCDTYRNIQYVLSQPGIVPECKHTLVFAKRDLTSIKSIIVIPEPYCNKKRISDRPLEAAGITSWMDNHIPTTLKNIVKLIYYTEKNEIKSFKEIQEEINNNKFFIAPPSLLFQKWEWEGVLLLYNVFTTEQNQKGVHKPYWENFSNQLITFIADNKKHTHWYLWGKDPQKFKKKLRGHCVYENANPEKSNCFHINDSLRETRHIINWTGVPPNKKNT